MLIGIISDTHDNLLGLKKGIKVLKERGVEMLVHCGDWVSPFTLEFFQTEIAGWNIPVKSVVGNNPGDTKRTIMSNSSMENPIEWPKTVTLTFEVDAKKVIVYHGDDYAIMDAIISCQKYDLLLTGNTHAPRNEVQGKTLIVNPGSTSYAAEGQIIEQASVAVYDTKSDQAEIIYLD